MDLEGWRQIKDLYRQALTQPAAERDDFLTHACADDPALRLGMESLLTLRVNDPTIDLLQPNEEMTPEQWRRIEAVFQEAADCPTDQLGEVLDRACGGDEGLRREVEALLAFQRPAPSFIKGVVDEAAEGLNLRAAGARPVPRPSPSADGIFVPGTILAGRYRILSQLGRGGMGAVYRADDLKLGQPVALKFLTEAFAQDRTMLARFHGEVRVARQVTHQNVCRVHDIGEIQTPNGNRHFLSMEYVDGEDLASLLRRIGRLPSDKAVEIARQLCVGLAAAHEVGVLHRDLKPANIMIDGRGQARVTDFGLAGLVEQFQGREVLAGTPAYMAPEQLAGKEVTVRSDIYALGLVIYELFTGKRAQDARSLDELRRWHESSTPANPSSWVKDIDPVVERVILRCLEKDPDRRPTSALQVAAALPGGDPLAAALAAGETPSPEMVAAAPKPGGLSPASALIAMASVIGALIVLVFLSERVLLVNRQRFDKPPEVLSDRAENLVKRFGRTGAATDRAYGFDYDAEYTRYLSAQPQTRDKWERAVADRPSLLYFWYRESPHYMVPQGSVRVISNDPPLLTAGMADVLLDPRGQLRKLQVVPPQIETPMNAPPPAPDWRALFVEAGLELTNFRPVAPQWIPPFYSDQRAAWEGTLPGANAYQVRIEAAAYRGQSIYFEIIGPWSQATRAVSVEEPAQYRAFQIFMLVVLVLALLAGALLARHNLRLERSDRKGAFRLAAFFFVISCLAWIFQASHVPILAAEVRLFISCLSQAVLRAGIVWLSYIALEPFVRRRWPERIIAWSRVLAGGWRDPLVGRDTLIGLAIGIWVIPFSLIFRSLYPRLGISVAPLLINFETLRGLRGVVPALFGDVLASIIQGLAILLSLLALTLLLRREWAASAVVWLVYVVGLGLALSDTPLQLVFFGMAAAAHLYLIMRIGLLSFIVAHFSLLHSEAYPLTTDLASWYAPYTYFAIFALLALAVYGFYTALAGQPLFRRQFLDPDAA